MIGKSGRRREAGVWSELAQRLALPIGFGALVLLAWEYGVVRGGISPSLLVPPSEVWRVIRTTYPLLLAQSVPTCVQLVVGFLAASTIGIVLGMLMTASTLLRQAIYPHIVLFQLVPKIAIAPLFIVWLGVGPQSRLAFAMFLSFFPVLIATVAGLSGTDRSSLQLCRSLTATGWQTFHWVRLPYAVPHIFDGLKIGATMSLTGLVVGEFVTAQAGLGYLVLFASSAAETGLVFAAVAFLCVIGLALYGAVALAERIVMRSLGMPPVAMGY
jgi:NitT/TauT family transport system permease protein